MAASKANNTLVAYRSGWKIFRAWCDDAGRVALPAEPRSVCQFATWTLEQGLRFETMQLRLKAISHFHREAGYENPARDESVRLLLRNAPRVLKERPGGKEAVTEAQIRKIARLECHTPTQLRNRTMLLLTFATGWRRSEVIALDRCDVRFIPTKGLLLWLRSSKTDQKGEGRPVGVKFGQNEQTCPVRAVREWLKVRGEWEGPLFTGVAPGTQTFTRERLADDGDTVRMALKDAIERIGDDPARYAAHSLRSGHVTTAFEHGSSLQAIKLRTGHKTTKVMERYIRVSDVFRIDTMEGVL